MKTRLTIGLALSLVFTSLTPAEAQAPVHKTLPRIVVPLSPKSFALRLVRDRGWSQRQFVCLVELWRRESNWNPKANNPYSTAFGIWQGLTETSLDPFIQIQHGITYIEKRYKSACDALKHSDQLGWY